MDEYQPYDTVTLEKLRYAVQVRLSENLIDANVNIETMADWAANTIVLQVRGMFWTEEKPVEELEVKYPADWKEAVKERFLRGWLLRRYPVRYKVHVLKLKVVYPDFKPAVKGQKFQFAVMKDIKYEP